MTRSRVLMALAVFGWGLWASAQSPSAGVSDPWAGTTVYRDEWGTPHLYASSFTTLGYAFGYVQAEDHLDAMLRAYRMANGRAAEVWGEAYTKSDEFALQMGHREQARAAFADLDPNTRELCTGFAMGVNAWIVEHPDAVPAWADGVKPEDPLALLHYFLMSHAPVDVPGMTPPAAAAFSGNAWAVDAKASRSGNALLAINPHTYYTGPFQWYEAHLVLPGMAVYGATLFGLPIILQGHNDRLGWALTPNKTDFADVYTQSIPGLSRNPGAVGMPRISSTEIAAWYLEKHAQPFYVKTEAGLKKQMIPVFHTAEGPVIGVRGDRLLVYHVGGYGDFGAMAQLVQMAQARGLTDFQTALSGRHLPCFNVVYADQEGTIFYLYNSDTGVRSDTAASPAPNSEVTKPDASIWEQPLPGDDAKYAWQGTVPFDTLPQLVNPSSGYVQACGSPPWTATEPSTLAPDAVPRWLSADRDSYRARRARQLLSTGQVSFYDCQAMLYDVVTPMAMDLVPWLLETADAEPEFIQSAHPDLPTELDLLRHWNFVAETDSDAMTFYHLWWSAFRVRGLRLYSGSEQAFYEGVDKRDPLLRQTLLDAAVDAVRLLRNEFQSVSVPWGKVHPIRRGDRTEPIGGAMSGEPLFLTSDEYYTAGEWPVLYGYAFAMAVRFSDPVEAVSVLPFGTSERPESPHFDDQLGLMLARQFKQTWFAADDVQRHAESARGYAITLRPAGVAGSVTLESQHLITGSLTADLKPPAPLPDGLTPFTTYITPRVAPPNASIHVALEVHIPPEVCAPAQAAQLALYAYTPDAGWYRMPRQQMDPATGAMRGWDDAARTYAVLGPDALRLATPEELPPPPPVIAQTPRSVLVPATPEAPLPEPQQLAKAEPEPKPEPTPEPVEPPSPEKKKPVVITSIPEKAKEYAAEPPQSAMVTQEELEQALAESRKAAAAALRVGPEELRQMTWGTDIALKPATGGLFSITASQPVGAHLVYSDEADRPLPDGLVLFTPIITVRATGSGLGSADMAMTVVVSADVCEASDLKKLTLYVYTSGEGWQPLKGQKLNPKVRTFSGFDGRLRSYAVLGPAEARLRAPSMPR